MKTYTTTTRRSDWASQSRIIHSGTKMNGLNRWSIQLMRKRHRYARVEKRGFTLWIAIFHLRIEVGTR